MGGGESVMNKNARRKPSMKELKASSKKEWKKGPWFSLHNRVPPMACSDNDQSRILCESLVAGATVLVIVLLVSICTYCVSKATLFPGLEMPTVNDTRLRYSVDHHRKLSTS